MQRRLGRELGQRALDTRANDAAGFEEDRRSGDRRFRLRRGANVHSRRFVTVGPTDLTLSCAAGAACRSLSGTTAAATNEEFGGSGLRPA